MISAIVAYFPKSRADKKKSLLGNKDSDEGGTVTKVCPLLLKSLINNFRMTLFFFFFLIGNHKAIINERKMKKQVHDDEQQEIKETNSTTNRG